MLTDVIARSGALPIENRLSEGLFERWIGYIDASPRTVDTYRKAIKHFLMYQISRCPNPDTPTRDDVVNYRNELKETYKPTTVQLYMTAVKLFFQWTAQEGIYPNIAEHIKGAKLDSTHKKDYLTSKQVQRLLESVDRSSFTGKRDYAILCLMVTTGLRTISVIRADIADLRTVGDDAVLYYQGKGHEEKADYVKLGDEVETAVREYLTERGAAEGGAPLFASAANKNSGERLTTRSISRIVKEQLKSAGFDSERLTAHSLRHTAATLNLLSGGTLEETQQLLGHTSVNTTMIYSHALNRAKNNSELRIAKAIFG